MERSTWPTRVHRRHEARRQFGDLPDHLFPFLTQADPLADEVVTHLQSMPTGSRHAAIGAALARPRDVSEGPMGALLRQACTVPRWVDWDAIGRAGELLRRSGVLGGLVLGLRSLVYGYAAPAGNKPLALTGRLERDGAHRLAETGRFVTAVCARAGLRVGAPGWTITLRVRLMHAQVRQLVRATGRYDEAAWGVPINQHDMLSTILLFSTVFTEGLEMLGLQVSEGEKEDYIQLWRLVAWIIGVDPGLIPESETSARRYAELILLTQGPPDDDARALTRALIEGPLRVLRDGDAAARRRAEVQRGLACGISRVMLGDELADGLALPRSRWRHVVGLLRPAVRGGEVLRGRSVVLRAVAETLGEVYWDASIRGGLGQRGARFELPGGLAGAGS